MRNRCQARSLVGGVEGHSHDMSSYRPRMISGYQPFAKRSISGMPSSRSLEVHSAWAQPSHSLQNDLGRRPRALKATPRIVTPSLLNSMREANGDVIIVLSDEAGFNPFAFPWPALRKVLVAIPSFRKYPFCARPRTQYCCPRTGACRWIGPQRRCNIVDVRRLPGATLVSQCRILSAHKRGESKVARNVSAELAVGAVQAVEGGSTGPRKRGDGSRSANANAKSQV